MHSLAQRRIEIIDRRLWSLTCFAVDVTEMRKTDAIRFEAAKVRTTLREKDIDSLVDGEGEAKLFNIADSARFRRDRGLPDESAVHYSLSLNQWPFCVA